MKKILLADDSITIQKVVELTFSDGDYQVHSVGNGAQALAKITELRPDVVLLDVIMPEKDGYEVCAAMRRDPRTAAIPTLLLSGTFEPFDERRAAAVGASGHMTKPFESHALISKVDELIASASSSPPAEDTAPLGTATGPSSATEAGAGAGVQQGSEPAPDAVAGSPVFPSPPPKAVAPSPVMQPPDATEGGSYRDPSHLDLGSQGEEMFPDRYDDVGQPSATVRMRREDIEISVPAPATAVPEAAPAGMADASPGMEGFVPGNVLQANAPETAIPFSGRDEVHESPGEAAPAAEPAMSPVLEGTDTTADPDAAAPATPTTTSGDAPGLLTQEALDQIAEQVVQRMSERVVREIAWEIIPEVAEAVVRQRIRELEEQDRS